MNAAQKTRWESMRERGAPFMLRLLFRCALALGRTGVRPIVYVTAAYFLVTSGAARRASRDFLRRALGREPALVDLWRQFLAFATCSTDRIFLLAGRRRGIEIHANRQAEVFELTNRGRPCIFVLAHFGNFEAARLIGDRGPLPISILLDREIGRMLTTLFEQLNPDFGDRIIDAANRGPELVLALKEAVDSGRMIGMMGDRTRAGDRSVAVEFFGSTAQLPIGPWMLAGALGVPVVLCFALYRGGRHYDVHYELFADRIVLPRGSREMALRTYAQQYARRLEHYARLAPYNWFNFYDFWQ
jgi:predicted LPLAT superfamily acyltransferase